MEFWGCIIWLHFRPLRCTEPTTIWNDNRGAVDWSQGCSVSRNLRHVNLRNMAVRAAQWDGKTIIKHIDGKKNISDILTKEHKNPIHYRRMASVITSPRRYTSRRDWNYDSFSSCSRLFPCVHKKGGCQLSPGLFIYLYSKTICMSQCDTKSPNRLI